MFKRVKRRTHGRRLDSNPISSPCEPSAKDDSQGELTKKQCYLICAVVNTG